MKQRLRKQILEKRNSITHEEADRKSKIIIEKLKNDPDYRKAKTIMFYVSKGKEVHTHNIINGTKDKEIIVPKVTNKGLICCKFSSMDKMKFSCYGILEPTDELKCDIKDIDLIIVPGIAFDKRGHRIGYGVGYYDNLLKSAQCKKIGLCYNFQLIEKIPNDEWDVTVDKVITD